MTTPTRDELAAYPCHMPCIDGHCHELCDFACGDGCDQRKVFDARIALRRAVLGDMTGEEAAREYRHHAEECYSHRQSHMEERMRALAGVAAKL